MKSDGDKGINPFEGTQFSVTADCPKWIEQATQQKNSRLTVELADSELLTYDTLDKKLLRVIISN